MRKIFKILKNGEVMVQMLHKLHIWILRQKISYVEKKIISIGAILTILRTFQIFKLRRFCERDRHACLYVTFALCAFYLSFLVLKPKKLCILWKKNIFPFNKH